MEINCPNGSYPKDKYCTYAIKNLKTRKPTEIQDFSKIPGCQWAIRDQESGYCFFKYLEQNPEEHSIAKIALLLEIPEILVKDLLDSAHVILKEHINPE